MKEKNNMFEKINNLEKKFLAQRKYKNYELYKEYERIKALRYFYDFSNNLKDIQKQREKKEKIIEEVKKLDIKEREKPLKPSISKKDLSVYQIKLYKIVNELFDFLIDKKNYSYLFKTSIMKELKLYLSDLTKIFEFRYKKSENLIRIQIKDMSKCLEIKEILKN